MRPKLLLLTLFLQAGLVSFAQQILPLGHWRTHLPFRTGLAVTQSTEAVYYATGQAVLTRDKTDGGLDFLTPVQGLSGTAINRIRYNRFSDVLLVVYDNSVIDLVKPDRISTLNQIRNFQNFPGNKVINDIFVQNDSVVYLAANYGISRLDIGAEIFRYTTFTGIAVESVVEFENFVYAATAEGLYRVSTQERNPEVFGLWEWLGPAYGLPGDYSAGAMVVFGGRLFVTVDGSLLEREPGGRFTEVLSSPDDHAIAFLSAEGQHLLLGMRCTGPACRQGKLFAMDEAGRVREGSAACFGDPIFGIEDEAGRIWFADRFRGFRHLENLDAGACAIEEFNSPWSEEVYGITIADDQLWLASGGVDVRFSYRFLDHGFASLIDGQWRVYNRITESALQGRDPDSPLLDFLSVAVDPVSGKAYAGAYFEGLAEVDGEQITIYDDSNSSLGNAVGDAARTRVSGLAFDGTGRLWVSNYLAERPLSTLSPEGEWQAYRPACGQTQIHQLGIDREGFKWAVVANTQAGVILFDEGDPGDPTDDRCRTFSSANSNLPTNSVNTVEVDLDGDVWVGTAEGVVIFECGPGAFDENCRGSRRIVEQDGFNAFLLATEDVRAIGVDGANRKWVGTQNGLFLLSANGNEQLRHFTTENSPLLSNVINDVTVHPRTGEVFIGTARGMISYQGDAVEGGSVHREPIEVFPNPVRPQFQGEITIRGLARDANVKITDVNGQLVYETTALGGQAVWDGRDYNGARARSGVYLVFSTSDPGDALFASKPDAAVARIVFIRGKDPR